MERNTAGLRGILFDEIDELRSGTADPKRSAAIAKLAQQILGTAKVEMEIHSLAMRAQRQGYPLEIGGVSLGEHVYLVSPPSDETSESANQSGGESES